MLQRLQYRLFHQVNTKTKLTQERIDMLNDLDFVWDCQGGEVPRRRKCRRNSSTAELDHLSVDDINEIAASVTFI